MNTGVVSLLAFIIAICHYIWNIGESIANVIVLLSYIFMALSTVATISATSPGMSLISRKMLMLGHITMIIYVLAKAVGLDHSRWQDWISLIGSVLVILWQTSYVASLVPGLAANALYFAIAAALQTADGKPITIARIMLSLADVGAIMEMML